MPDQLVKDNIATLQQAEMLLLCVARHELKLEDKLGPHLRHVLDHYDSFLDGLSKGRIDYDARARDTATETRIGAAQQRIARIHARLADLASGAWPDRIEVSVATNADAPGRASWSTPERELQFLQSHAVHHYALIRLLLDQRGVSIDEDFGKAPSTVRYERASA